MAEVGRELCRDNAFWPVSWPRHLRKFQTITLSGWSARKPAILTSCALPWNSAVFGPIGHSRESFTQQPLKPGPLIAEMIHAGYRTLAKKYHPDMGGNTQQMQQLNEAFERWENSTQSQRD